MEETFKVFLGILILVYFIFIHPLFGYIIGRKSIVNKLCQKQQYEFCEVSRTIYKLKGEK